MEGAGCYFNNQGFYAEPSSDKESARQCRRHGFDPWFGKIPWSMKWQPIPVFLPGKHDGQRSLVGLQSVESELDLTEHAHVHHKEKQAVCE